MKKLFTIIFSIALILPLYSQEVIPDNNEYDIENEITNDESAAEASVLKPEKKKFDFTRKYFETGLNAGVGFDNGLVSMSDVLRKEIVVDLSKLTQNISKNGVDINFSPNLNFFVNVKNISIGKNIWDFYLFTDVEGGIKTNISKSMLTLISEGNFNQHDSSGSISLSGGIFTDISVKGSTKYEIAGRPLYVSAKPSIFTPAVYIPSGSGITYYLSTKKDDKEGIFVHTKGGINIYTPTSLENVNPGRFIIGPSGFDLSLEGEYALFPFLDVGGSISNIPFAAAILTNQMNLSMTEFQIELSGEDMIAGKGIEIPDIEFKKTYINSSKLKIHRLLRFDIYGRYKPFDSEFMVLRSNIGFSANINKGDGEGYFNVGTEASLSPINILTIYMGTSYTETIWKHKAGLVLNFRAFELDLETALRNQNFIGAFMGRGLYFNLGLRFGW
jgi:hypothetical protein